MSALPPSSRTPPGIQAPGGASKTGCGKGCLYVLGGFVVLVGISAAIGFGSAGDSDDAPSMNNSYEAIAQCEARIDKLLKAPATADYNTDATGSGAGPWTVTGTVDAENSFGANVRADYGCTVTMQGDMATTAVDYFNE